jgi:hypothetical protein
MANTKELIFKNIVIHYQGLSESIRSLPFPPHLMTIILQSFDTGFLWTKEAFSMLDFPETDKNETQDSKVNSDSIELVKSVDDDAA